MKSKSKIIKRYQNRKLYDTSKSCYITLENLAGMIRRGDDITVIDNKSGRDITSNTLTQIIFETERKSSSLLPTTLLRDIIKSGGGSISDMFHKTIQSGVREIANMKGEIQRKINNVTGASRLRKEIDRLQSQLTDVQKKLKKYESLERKKS